MKIDVVTQVTIDLQRSSSCATDPAEAESERLSGLARALRDQILTRDFVIPLLPDVARHLMALAIDPDVSVRDLESEIRNEPMIAAKVLSAANSSLYATKGSVASLHQAALRLGATVLRDLLSQAVAEAFVFTGRSRRLLRSQRAHAVAVAHLTRKTCRVLDIDPEHAFLAGLLHDIGHPVLLATLVDHPLEGMRAEDVGPLVEFVHPLIGERIARRWELPGAIGEVARYHHCYRGTSDFHEFDPLVSIVAAADRLAYHAGIGLRDLGIAVHDDPIWPELGLNGEAVDTLVYEAVSLGGSVGTTTAA